MLSLYCETQGLGVQLPEIDTSARDRATKVFWNANPAVRQIILEQSALHVQARLATSAAMQARLSQVAALLLAGAAIGAQLAYSIPREPGLGPIAGLAGLSSALFAIGGIVSLAGLKAADLYIPGPDPAWWAQAPDIEAFMRGDAETWVVGHTQEVIDSLDRQATRRAKWLNLGLRYGAVAGALIALAGILVLFR